MTVIKEEVERFKAVKNWNSNSECYCCKKWFPDFILNRNHIDCEHFEVFSNELALQKIGSIVAFVKRHYRSLWVVVAVMNITIIL